MKYYHFTIIHSGYAYNYQHFVKEILLPMYVYLLKDGLIDEELEIKLTVKGDVSLYTDILKLIFPKIKFIDSMSQTKYQRMSNIQHKPSNDLYKPVILQSRWTMSMKTPRYISKHELHSFIKTVKINSGNHLKNIQNKSKNIILIQRRNKLRSEIYCDRNDMLPAYINRDHRKTITNHHELQLALEKYAKTHNYQFHNIFCEDLTFIEQVKIFSEADIVIGQHGAGLVNIMWTKLGAHIIEIVPEIVSKSQQHPHWVNDICCYIGLNYHLYTGSVISNTYNSPHRNNKSFNLINSDITIDCVKFIDYMKKLTT